ncbi:hypothetical protein [Pseudooceanicola sp.]|uniref:hypothetical protein n=1 Tax=Pseudooceanicola sp. TaxID=1914328 RepID=UPI0035156F97
MIDTIPFRVPNEFLVEQALGTVKRYGAILKDVETGRIVAHVQETGMLQRILDVGLSVEPSGASNILGLVQNAKIINQLNALQQSFQFLQSLQLVNIASSVAGIGVSAAGTALVLRRLNVVNQRLGRIEETVGKLPQQIRDLDIRKTLTEVKTALERLAGSAQRRDAEDVTRSAEERLHYAFDRLMAGTEETLKDEEPSPELLKTLLSGLSLCGSAQIRALYALDEMDNARAAARSQYQKVHTLSMSMPYDILLEKLQGNITQLDQLTVDFSELRYRFASVPDVTERLIDLGVDGPAYLARLEGENTHPILILPADDL